VRVSKKTTDAIVTMTYPGTIFGKIDGTSGKKWAAANDQIGGN